ncbi:hypothetical protein C6I21_01585 [Alkalicoccus urumqiensis]|uniref:Uncharacterized protein n=1 Tax=Alkalicoccus urumqiensis TaxID=1548213 RepID=A0A2P6MLV1_ALKUR|nr:hypothetical protein C6I21_01585 [Alkalicoccus urumqiensis]
MIPGRQSAVEQFRQLVPELFFFYSRKFEASSSRALFARLYSISGAGLWFKAQGSELLPCGAAARSRAEAKNESHRRPCRTLRSAVN